MKRSTFVKHWRLPKLVVALSAEMKWCLIPGFFPKACFSFPKRPEHQSTALVHITKQDHTLNRIIQKIFSKAGVFPNTGLSTNRATSSYSKYLCEWAKRRISWIPKGDWAREPQNHGNMPLREKHLANPPRVWDIKHPSQRQWANDQSCFLPEDACPRFWHG